MEPSKDNVNDIEKGASTDSPEHLEIVSTFPGQLDEDLKYGQGGLKGLLTSPYVFGAAMLASLGGFSFGAFLGCLIFPKLTDRISRKWGLSCAVGIFCVGAIIQTASMNYGTLVAGRFIGGIGVGTLAMGAPLYSSEISPPDLRGSLLTLEQLSIVVGAIIAYWITYGTR